MCFLWELLAGQKLLPTLPCYLWEWKWFCFSHQRYPSCAHFCGFFIFRNFTTTPYFCALLYWSPLQWQSIWGRTGECAHLVYSFRCFHCGGLALLFLHCDDTEYPAREGVARQSFHLLETGRRERVRERKRKRGWKDYLLKTHAPNVFPIGPP